MDFRFSITFFSIIFLLLPVSCSSVKGAKRISGEAVMYGMVYNNENMPVSNAEVIVDGKSIGITDAQGRFVLTSKQRKEFTITLKKPGYETVEGSFRFEPMDVIHMVMVNADQLVKLAEAAMDEGRYREVIAFCDRALDLNLERADAYYIKAISLIRLKEYGRARYILEELEKQLGEREYIRRILEELPQ